MRFVYCGYDFFWNVLQSLVQGGHSLSALYTFRTDNQYDFNHKVTALARNAKAPVHLSPISTQSLARIPRQERHLLICAAYPSKIPAEVIETFDYAVNVHPSLLPQGRGPWPLPWTILRNEPVSGVTLHKLTANWDAGDILLQREVNIAADENLESLSAKLQLIAAPLVSEFVARPDIVWNNATPQGVGSYCGWPTETQRTVSWDDEVADIQRLVRAFGKFESYAWIEGKKYFVRDVSVWQQTHAFKPGTLVHAMNRESVVAARDGFVCLRQFELAPRQNPRAQ